MLPVPGGQLPLAQDNGTQYQNPAWTPLGNHGVAFVAGSTLAVSATFFVTPAPFNILPGWVFLAKGTGPNGMTVEGTLSFTSPGTLTLSPTFFDQPLPAAVNVYDPFVINWQICSLVPPFVGCADKGSTQFKLYVTYGESILTSATSTVPRPLYETVVDIGSRSAQGQDDPQSIVQEMWSKFQSLNVSRVGVPNAPSIPPTQMGYWTNPNRDQTCQSLAQMLLNDIGDGSCAAWAQLWHQVLDAQGLGGSNIYKITPDQNVNPGSGGFLIKNWKFGNSILTGPNGIMESLVAGDDYQDIDDLMGLGFTKCVTAAPGTILLTTPGGDDEVSGTTIDSGMNGICESAKVGTDIQVLTFEQGKPNQPGIEPGPDGILDSTKGGDDVVVFGQEVGSPYPFIVYDNQINVWGDVAPQTPLPAQNNPCSLAHQNDSIDGIYSIGGQFAVPNNPSVLSLAYQAAPDLDQ
jgi:hypothetical protein